MARIISLEKSIVVSCDVRSIDELAKVVKETHDVDGIGGYKVSSDLVVRYGLPALVKTVRDYTNLAIIYDHQKWGSDLPHTADGFADAVKSAGVDALIIFPLSGPATQQACMDAAKKYSLPLIAGGDMTTPNYLDSEGGYIAGESLLEMYGLSARNGISNFVVPGTKKDKVELYLNYLKEIVEKPVLWSPGFVAQGGSISEAAKVAGDSFHAIVGRGIIKSNDMHAAAVDLARQLHST